MKESARKLIEAARRRRLDYVAVFSVTAVFFWLVQGSGRFLDPDSFYHAKMGLLTLQNGIVFDFPWLPFTTLARHFADHHYIYHLLLAPFILWLGPLYGTKLATAVFAAAAVTAFYWMLRAYAMRGALAFTALLATSGGFLLRVNLAKATALSLTCLMFALVAVKRDQPWRLFVISWVFVWLYGGWPIMLILAGAFLLGRVIAAAMDMYERGVGGREAFAGLWKWPETRNLRVIAAGLACGLVVNPFFPKNLMFYWDQIFQIAMVTRRVTVSVGSEWYPSTLAGLFDKSAALFILLMVAAVLFMVDVFWSRRDMAARPSRRAVAEFLGVAILALTFFLLTLRSRRHVEYFVPLGMLFIAHALNLLVPRLDFSKWAADWRVNDHKIRFALVVLAVYMALILPLIAARDAYEVRLDMDKGVAWTKYEQAARWLTDRVPAGEVIFTSDWDDFPPLFLRDDIHRYIIGLDPTFLYLADEGRYRAFVGLTLGEMTDGAAGVVRDMFGSSYILIEKDHAAFRDAVAADDEAELVYEDDEAWIYSVKP
jgi:hypothetical protein